MRQGARLSNDNSTICRNPRREPQTQARTSTTSDRFRAGTRDVLGGKGSLTALHARSRQCIAGRAPRCWASSELRSKPSSSARSMRAKPRFQSRAALNAQLAAEAVDVTLPGRKPTIGVDPSGLADDRRVERDLRADGLPDRLRPEVETGYYNFDLLNIPSDHPARDVWDTMIVETNQAARSCCARTPRRCRRG